MLNNNARLEERTRFC